MVPGCQHLDTHHVRLATVQHPAPPRGGHRGRPSQVTQGRLSIGDTWGISVQTLLLPIILSLPTLECPEGMFVVRGHHSTADVPIRQGHHHRPLAVAGGQEAGDQQNTRQHLEQCQLPSVSCDATVWSANMTYSLTTYYLPQFSQIHK